MATVQEILAISNYQGQGSAGGRVSIAENINISPISQLAQYTYMKNKEQWDRDNKKRDEAVDYIAKSTALDPIGLLGEQNEVLIKRKQALDAKSEDPSYFNPDKDFKKFSEYQKEYADLQQDIARANKNNVNAGIWQEKINKITDPKEKALQQELFDTERKNFFKDGVEPKIKSGSVFAQPNEISKADYAVPTVDYNEIESSVAAGNYITSTNRVIGNLGALDAKASEVVLGLKPPKYSYDNTINAEGNKKREIEYKIGLSGSKVENLYKTIDSFNVALAQPDVQNNSIVNGIKTMANRYNEEAKIYNDGLQRMTAEGVYTHGMIPATLVDVENGLTPEELIKLQTHSAGVQKSIKVEKKYTADENDRIKIKDARDARISQDAIELKRITNQNNQFYAGLNNKDKDAPPPKGGNTSAYIKIAQTFTDATKGAEKKAMRVNELSVAEIAAINPSFVKTVNGNTTIDEDVLTNDIWFTFDKNGNIFVEDQEDKKSSFNKTYQPSVIDVNGVGQIQTTYKDRKDEVSIYDVRPEFRFNIGQNAPTNNSSGKRVDEFGVPY